MNSGLRFQLEKVLPALTRTQELVNACGTYAEFKTRHAKEFIPQAQAEGFAGLREFYKHYRTGSQSPS
jgi:hypothetical protein